MAQSVLLLSGHLRERPGVPIRTKYGVVPEPVLAPGFLPDSPFHSTEEGLGPSIRESQGNTANEPCRPATAADAPQFREKLLSVLPIIRARSGPTGRENARSAAKGVHLEPRIVRNGGKARVRGDDPRLLDRVSFEGLLVLDDLLTVREFVERAKRQAALRQDPAEFFDFLSIPRGEDDLQTRPQKKRSCAKNGSGRGLSPFPWPRARKRRFPERRRLSPMGADRNRGRRAVRTAWLSRDARAEARGDLSRGPNEYHVRAPGSMKKRSDAGWKRAICIANRRIDFSYGIAPIYSADFGSSSG